MERFSELRTNMNVDSAFAIGKRHEVCQDYAQTGTEGKLVGGWIADGCSSSRDSDIGARLLVLSARQALRAMVETGWQLESSEPDEVGLMSISGAMVAAKVMDLPPETLDATLLSVVSDGEHVCLSMFGDGVLYMEWEEGSSRTIDIELTNGYPDYLSYRIDKARRKKYDSLWTDGTARKVVRGHKDLETLDPHKVYAEIHELEQFGVKIALAVVMSDGVRSFYKRLESGANEPVPLDEVLDNLLDFKLFSGRFVQRRLNRFLKDTAACGWEHHDDIAIAAIHFGKEQ
jgi:hypothetical protein